MILLEDEEWEKVSARLTNERRNEMRVELIDDFVNQKGKPRVLLEFIPNEFKKDIVYRIVHNPDQNKYTKEVLQKNAMGESVWVFSESWFADNTNNTCIACNSPCKTCVQHPSKCLTCLSGSFFEFACPQTCPYGTFNDNGICKYYR